MGLVNGNLILVNYMKDVCSALSFFTLNGDLVNTIPVDFPAADLTISGSRSHGDVFVYETSFITPGNIHHIDLTKPNPTWKLYIEPTVPGFKSSDFVAKQVFYKSKDGTDIPMFVVQGSSLSKSTETPTLLYGYGGFNISITPSFSVSRLLWCDLFDGIYAVANIRGGGEYGESWHQQGILDRKQNVFDDFIYAGEYLIKEGYTSSEKLVIEGGSNGGL